LFLVVMTLLRLVTHLIAAREALPVDQAVPAFWLGLRFDGRVVALVLLPLLILGTFPFLNPFRSPALRRTWIVFFSVVSAALLVIYTADFLHYRYLGQRLNATVLAFMQDASTSAAMAWESYPLLLIAAGIGVSLVVMVAALGASHRWTRAAAKEPRRAVRVTWFVATLLTCLVAIFGRIGQFPLRWSDAFNLRNEAAAQLALNPIESFTSSLRFRTTSYSLEKVREHYPRMSAYLGVTPPDVQRLSFERRVAARMATPTTRRPNVVLVICESFSGYKSSMWGNPLDTTPFFAGLTREGIFFDNCFTPHFGTARGVWATITGTPDVSPVETASRNPAMVDQHTIIDDFEGYEKLYFLGGSSSWANIRGLLTNNIRGLKLYEEDSYDSPRADVWGISDKNLFLEAEKILRTQTKPFFAIIQTADNHRPYTIPKEDRHDFKTIDLPEATVRQHGFESLAELNAFRYTDYSFRKFFEAARTSPYFDDTIFVFIGDHGIGGNAGPGFPPAWTDHHLTRYHVPLLFYAPKLLPAQRIHSVASMVDVLPTIAGLADITYRNRTFGRDLLLRQKVDGGAGNVAFIIDHNDRTIGVVQQQHYGLQRAGSRPHLLWADFASPAPATSLSDADQAEFQTLAQAFHDTAQYLLLHNPKHLAAKPTGVARSANR
jgi:phosphoglycerol transferase MdoB-like AlkP superfamily enzyme